MRRMLVVAAAVVTVLALAPLAHAGEITGTGKLLLTDGRWGTGLHARSFCAYSGQEDRQFFTDDSDSTPVDQVVRGVPGHAQSWGQFPKSVRDALPAELHPGVSCNPNRSTFTPP